MKKALIVFLIGLSMLIVGCKDVKSGDGLKDGNNNEIVDNSEIDKDKNKGDEVNKEDDTAKSAETKKEDDTAKSAETKKENEVVVSKYTINDLIGIKANEKYSYEGSNSEFAEYVRYVDYIDGNKFQVRSNNSGAEYVKVIEATNDELRVVFYRGVCDYRENFLKKPATKNEILLKAPIAKGTSWTLEDGSKRYISSIDAKVSTSMGEYECIEVTTENKSGEKDLQYYAQNVGLVKEIYDVGNMAVTSTLGAIEKDVRLTQVIRCYYPDEEANFMKYEDVEVSFATNDITRLTLQNKFREFKGGDSMILTEGVSINSLYLNDDGMVYLDLTKSFISEMANGTTGEYFAIQDLVNTLGRYYGVENVYITLDGENYESGHISKEKGESFSIDLSRVK